ncbi:MAG: DUF2339 domain-containing protein [Reyranellaceae bacterium]
MDFFDDGWVVLLILVVVFLVAFPVIAIVALVRSYGLESQIEQLRLQLAALRRPTHAPTVPEEAPQPTASPPAASAEIAPPSVWETPPVASEPPAPPSATPPSAAPEPTSVAPRPRRGFSLEQALGARAFAWIGALAIALAGVFLVKYSIDQGYLDPPARVTLAGILGVALLATGEWLRRRDARIAQALTAAGVAVLFSALFAAVGLYDLFPRLLASLLAIFLTALSIGLSLRHGPFVALLGLVGGAIAPAIVGDQNSSVPVLFGYLLALTAGVLVVVRHRQWWWLGWCVLVPAAGWTVAWIGGAFTQAEAVFVACYLLAVIGLYVWVAWRSLAAPQDNTGLAAWLARHARGLTPLLWGAAFVMLALQAMLLARADYADLHWVFFLVAGLSLFALGRRVPALQYLTVLPVLLSVWLFVAWANDFVLFGPPGMAARDIAITALVVAFAFSGSAYALMWNAARPGFWAALSAGAALLHFLAICAVLYRTGIGFAWGYASLALAAPFLLAASRVAFWRGRMQGADEALGMLAVGVTFFVSAAVPLELRREWVTMAYAIELPAVAWIAWRLNLPILRWLAWLLAGTVTIRLVFNPYVLDYDVSSNPLLNWVLYGYGVPIASYWIARHFLKRVRNDELVMAIEASILAFGFLLLSLQVRSIFNPDGLGQPRFEIAERAWMAVSWGALALGLIWGAWHRPHPVLVWGWRIVGGLAIALVATGALFWFDELFEAGGVGSRRVFNGLIVCFLLPALLAAAGAWMLQRMGERAGVLVAGIAALVFGFAFLGYEVRHYFNFAGDGIPAVSGDAELYAYSIVWLAYGAGLLVAGILTRQALLRYASLAVLVLVVAKVFLLDMSDLTGLLRVASFLGLGIALLALGFLYRRYVFRDDSEPADTAGAAE